MFKWSNKVLEIPLSRTMLRINLDIRKHGILKSIKRAHVGRTGLYGPLGFLRVILTLYNFCLMCSF